MIHLREIDHLVLRVIDLDRMLGFYCGVLGCAVERRDDALGLVQLRAGRSLVDLVPVGGVLGKAGGAPAGNEGRNLDHFCFRVEPFDEAAIRSQLESHKVAAGPVQTRNGAEGEGPSIYVADPEGNVVELKGPAGAALSAARAEQLRDLERSRLRALVECDMPLAWQLHAPDFQLVTPGGRAFTREQYLGKIERGILRYLRWEPGPMQVRLRSDMALVRYQATLEIDAGGGHGTPFQCWHIDAYELNGTAWQVVWSQATAVKP